MSEYRTFSKIRPIAIRSHSELHLVKVKGKEADYVHKVMRPNGPNGEVSREILEKGYEYYKELRDAKVENLVEIYDAWWDGKAMNYIMEHLTGFVRVTDVKVLNIHARCGIFLQSFSTLSDMIDKGFISYDFDPTNVMVNIQTEKFCLIDLDKIMRVEDALVDRGHYGTWFASRVVRFVMWLTGKFDLQKQYTKVVKL